MYFRLINSTYTIMKEVNVSAKMLDLSLVRDVALLGVLEGRGLVAGRGELLLEAGGRPIGLEK